MSSAPKKTLGVKRVTSIHFYCHACKKIHNGDYQHCIKLKQRRPAARPSSRYVDDQAGVSGDDISSDEEEEEEEEPPLSQDDDGGFQESASEEVDGCIDLCDSDEDGVYGLCGHLPVTPVKQEPVEYQATAPVSAERRPRAPGTPEEGDPWDTESWRADGLAKLAGQLPRGNPILRRHHAVGASPGGKRVQPDAFMERPDLVRGNGLDDIGDAAREVFSGGAVRNAPGARVVEPGPRREEVEGPAPARPRGYCGTLFLGPNGGPREEQLRGIFEKHCRGSVYQLERASTGRLHWQFYIQFSSPTRFATALKIFGDLKPHLEVARGSPEDNIKYCTKDDTRVSQLDGGGPFYTGVLTGQAAKCSKRPDQIQALVAAAKEGKMSMEDARASREFCNLFFGNYKATVDTWKHAARKPPANFKIANLRTWQRQLQANLVLPPHGRRVFWFYDKDGAAGKSSFVRHMIAQHGDAVFVTDGSGKLDDIKFSWAKANELVKRRYCFIDIPRASEHDINTYRFVEKVKDMMSQNNKYESGMTYTDQCHVVVFSNRLPNVDQLSMDRWTDSIFSLVRTAGDDYKAVCVDPMACKLLQAPTQL